MNKMRMAVQSKLAKTFAVSVCAALLMTGSAFAAEGGVVPGSMGGGTNSSSGAAADLTIQPAVIDDGTLKLQREIDEYLFVTHQKEMEKLEFKVTHTAPMDGVVEIGITPYEEEYADYLYGIFGADNIRVVQGEQARTLIEPDAPVFSIAPEGPAVPASSVGWDADAPVAGEPEPYMELMVVGQEPPAEGEMAVTSVVSDNEDAGAVQADAAVMADAPASQGNQTLFAGALALLVAAVAAIAYFARKARRAKA